MKNNLMHFWPLFHIKAFQIEYFIAYFWFCFLNVSFRYVASISPYYFYVIFFLFVTSIYAFEEC